MQLGKVELVEQTLMYEPWRDGGRDLAWASIVGLVSDRLNVWWWRGTLPDRYAEALGVTFPIPETDQSAVREKFLDLWEKWKVRR